MGVSTTNKQLFIVELDHPFSTLEIQFVPQAIKSNRSAKLQTVAIVGRNDDLLHYTGGKETLKLELEFYAQDDSKKEVFEKINWLKSMTMNNGSNGKFRNVKLVFGDLFKNQVWAISNVSPDMSHLSAGNSWMPLRAKVNIDFILDPEKNRFIDDVRNGR